MRRAAGLVLLISLVAVAPAAARTERIAGLRAQVPVATYGTTIAWSAYDDETKSYRLMVRHDGDTSAPEVDPRPVPFDVDVGPGEDRRLVVYSRCDSDATASKRTRGCDLFSYDLDGEREARIAGASSDSADERLPTVSGDRLVFTRTRGAGEAALMLRRDGRTESLRGAPEQFCLGGMCQDIADRAITRLDLSGARLAVAVHYSTSGFEAPIAEVRLVSANTGASERIVRAASSARTAVRYVGVGFEGQRLYIGASCSGDADGCLQRHGFFRYDATRRALSRADASRRVNAFSWSGGRAVYAADPASGDCGDRACTLVTRTGLVFRPVPRPS